MAKQTGRPPGLQLHAEGFEALLASSNMRKADVARIAEVSPGYIGDLLAHRTAATLEKAERIATALDVIPAAIFPGLVRWVGPPPERDGTRGA